MKLFVALFILLSLSPSSFAEQQQDFGSYTPSTPKYEMIPAEAQLSSGVRGLTEAKFQSLISGHAATGKYCRTVSKPVVDEMNGSPHVSIKNGQSVYELELNCNTGDRSRYSDNCEVADYSWVVHYQIPVNGTVTELNYTNFIDNNRTTSKPVRLARTCKPDSYYGSGRSGGGYEPYKLPPPQPMYLGNGVWLH